MANYIEVEMPDGSIAEFPSNMSDRDISAAIRKSFIPKQPQQKESFLKQATRGPRNLGAGLNKLIRKAANVPSDLASLMGDQESADILSVMKDYDIDAFWGLPKPEQQHWSDQLVQAGPEIAGAFLLPEAELGQLGTMLNKIPKGGKYLSKILSQGAPQAAYAAALAPNEQRAESAGIAGATQAPFSVASQLALSPKPQYQKLASVLGGVGAGALTGYGLNEMGAGPTVSAIGAGLAGKLGAKGLGTKGMMMQEHAGGKNLPKAQERMKLAERLNLDFLTPEEAFNSPFLARKQGRLGRTEEGSELMYDKFQKRVESEQTAINRVLKQIHDPEVMGPKATELYKQSYKHNLPEDLIIDLSQDPVIKHAINDVLKKPAYQKKLENVPVENFAFWDQVKKALGDMAEGAPKEEASIINETRKSLVKKMDDISPEYKQARALEERKFARQELESVFDKSNIRSGHQFYKALNSAEDFDKLMHNLRNVPVARAKLKAMRELFKDFRKESTINKVRGLEQTGMKQHRNDLNALMSYFEDTFSGGKFDKEAIEFITSKDWDQQLKEISKITDKQKRMSETITLFGKIAAQANAKKKDD